MATPLGADLVNNVFKTYANLKTAFDAGLSALSQVAADLKAKSQGAAPGMLFSASAFKHMLKSMCTAVASNSGPITPAELIARMHTAAVETYARLIRWHELAINLRDAPAVPAPTLNPLDDSFRALIWSNLTLPKTAMVHWEVSCGRNVCV